jgi:arabinose-5-phosphate isomerase
LYLKVSDISIHNALPVVHPDATLKEVIVEISSKRLGCTAVAEGDKKLLGIITDGDLRRMLEKNPDLSALKARDIMTRNPKTIQQDEFAVKALQQMQENNITQLVVMDGERLAGFIHLHDLLKEGIA